ncbi:hypothetical protein MJD09_13680 [bacterium]|nr:hypothetical protein [bacterium]
MGAGDKTKVTEQVRLSENARLVLNLGRLVNDGDMDELFRELGRHMDKHKLQLSREVVDEFELANRVRN